MPYIRRILETQVEKAARGFPALLVTGPRQCGKTTLLRKLFPRFSYVLLEDPDVIARVRADPRSFLEELTTPVILDEIQNTPELLNYVRTRIDGAPSRRGQWLLTGSQEAPLMQGVAESMVGRAAVLQLLPLSTMESPKVSVLRGGYPGVVTRPSAAELWFRSYVQTYLERDIRAITAVRDLGTYRRFLALLASRCGTLLNKTELAGPLGVSVPTITEWLNALEITGQILLVPPFYENFGKRLVKTPKLFFVDSGLACHLLGIENAAALRRSALYGRLFEGFVAAEIAKRQVNGGGRVQLYYFRDQQGLEVDLIVPQGPDGLALIEAKASKTPLPSMARPLQRLADSIRHYTTRSIVVHGGTAGAEAGTALLPGVAALSMTQLLEWLQ
ncbi:MAG: ATP-binding protein [Acidiferrobacteraceae bacterium]